MIYVCAQPEPRYQQSGNTCQHGGGKDEGDDLWGRFWIRAELVVDIWEFAVAKLGLGLGMGTLGSGVMSRSNAVDL